MHTLNHDVAEQTAMIDRFMSLGARWCLSNLQVAELLALGRTLDVMFDEEDIAVALSMAGRDSERRMRLLIEVDRLLPRLVPEAAIAEWLRAPSVGYADERVPPLTALSSGAGAILALRDYLRDLPHGGARE